MLYGLNFEHYSWWWQINFILIWLLLLRLQVMENFFMYQQTLSTSLLLPINPLELYSLLASPPHFLPGCVLFHEAWSFDGKSFLITYHCWGFLFHFTHYSLSQSGRLVSHHFISRRSHADDCRALKRTCTACNSTLWKIKFQPHLTLHFSRHTSLCGALRNLNCGAKNKSISTSLPFREPSAETDEDFFWIYF